MDGQAYGHQGPGRFPAVGCAGGSTPSATVEALLNAMLEKGAVPYKHAETLDDICMRPAWKVGNGMGACQNVHAS